MVNTTGHASHADSNVSFIIPAAALATLASAAPGAAAFTALTGAAFGAALAPSHTQPTLVGIARRGIVPTNGRTPAKVGHIVFETCCATSTREVLER